MNRDCCGKTHEHAFCSVCGSRLEENKYLGQSERSIEYEMDRSRHDLDWAVSAVRTAEQQAKELIAGPTQHLEKLRQNWRLMLDALEYARKNRIEA